MLFVYDATGKVRLEWHVGEPVPPIQANVLRFQADGDELQLFLAAMRGTRKERRRDA